MIREVTASTGNINTVAGNGSSVLRRAPLPCGDSGIATSAQLSFPVGVFVDVQKTSSLPIHPTIAFARSQPRPASLPPWPGPVDAATQATAPLPPALCWILLTVFSSTLSGDIFIADTENAAIREVVAATGFIQTVAGIPATLPETPRLVSPAMAASPPARELNSPSGLFGNSAGNLC